MVEGASFTDLPWVIDAYALMLAALVLPVGSLADRLGRRRFFAAGLGVFSVASLLAPWHQIRRFSTCRVPSQARVARRCSRSPSP